MRFDVGSAFESRVCESVVTLDRVLNDLTAANGDKAQLPPSLTPLKLRKEAVQFSELPQPGRITAK